MVPPADAEPRVSGWHALVTVATFPHVHQAELARSKLEAEGLDAVVADAYLTRLMPLYAPAVGWVKVQVPGDQVVAARAALARDDTALVRGIGRAAPAGAKVLPFTRWVPADARVVPPYAFWVAWGLLAAVAVGVLRPGGWW